MTGSGIDKFGTVSDMRVTILAVDGCLDSGLAIIQDALTTANALRTEVTTPPPR